jgi:ABC-2 type transport system ATP-binding protein
MFPAAPPARLIQQPTGAVADHKEGPMAAIIEVTELRKRYGATVAVDGISLTVQAGEILGIVGPNGAGKTTTVECLEGLRRPDAGTVRVLGLDPRRQGAELRQRIGVQLQQAALPDRLKVWEALDLYASFYRHPADWRLLLEEWGLAAKRDAAFADLSGGQRQRLFIALALVGRPEVVFLDELTTGLDPQARRTTWELVRQVRAKGATVVLVTHFMEEAELLCDRVAIVDRGRVVAMDAPGALVRGLGAGQRLRFRPLGPFDPDSLRALPGVQRVDRDGDQVVVSGGGPLLATVAAALADRAVAVADLRSEEANLEDAFLALTGRALRD